MDTVAAMVLFKGDDILILKHKKHNMWSIPLGKVEEGETPEKALKREMREELGIEIESLREIANEVMICDIPDPTPVIIILFEVESYKGEIENKEPHKHSDIHFEGYEKLLSLEVTQATKLLLRKLIAIMIRIPEPEVNAIFEQEEETEKPKILV